MLISLIIVVEATVNAFVPNKWLVWSGEVEIGGGENPQTHEEITGLQVVTPFSVVLSDIVYIYIVYSVFFS